MSDTALPLVAVVMEELYARRTGRLLTHVAYDASGGVAGTLSRRADAALAPLMTTVVAPRLWQFFRNLFKMDAHGRVARCPLTRSDALASLGGGAGAEAILAQLTGGSGTMRLLFIRGDGAGARVDLVHDALLRSWAWLRERIDADRAELLREAEVTQAAERWQRLGRPRDGLPGGGEAEYFLRASTVPGSLADIYKAALGAHLRRRRNLVRAIVSVLSVGVLALAGATTYALRQRSEAQEQMQLAAHRLTAANVALQQILLDALPKLAAIPGSAEVRKQIHGDLETLQQTLLADAGDDIWLWRHRMLQHQDRGVIALTHDDLSLAQQEFSDALRIAEALLELAPHRATFLRDLSISLNKLGDVEVYAGNLAGARAHFERSLALAEDLAKTHPDRALAQSDLSLVLNKLGNVEVQMGNLASARAHVERSLSVVEAMVEADPHSAEAKRDLSAALERLGDVEMQTGNLAGARAHFERSLAVCEVVAKSDPHDALAQRTLSIALKHMGDVEKKTGNLARAQAHFERSLSLAAALAKADPESIGDQRGVSSALDMLGRVEVETGNLAGARSHFERSLAVAEALAKADPHSAQAQRDFLVSLGQLGDVEVRAGNLAGAQGHFERALAVAEALTKADPESVEAQSYLSVSLGQLGDVEAQAGNRAGARALYERSLSVAEALTKSDPNNAERSYDLATAHIVLYYLAETEKNTREMRKHLIAADALLDTMEADGQIAGYAKRKDVRALINQLLAELK